MFCAVQIQDGVHPSKRRPTKGNISIGINFFWFDHRIINLISIIPNDVLKDPVCYKSKKNDNIIHDGGYFALIGHL